MSLILKGIDLPNSGQIELIIRPHGKVLSKTRGISAEAIQIPKGHGRIVDADTIFQYGAWDERAVSEAPTILNAERRGT